MARLDFTGLQTFKTEYDAFIATILGNDIASAYSSSTPYSVGAYVIYNYTLYKCTYPITTGEAWNVEHWTQVNISTELSNSSGGYEQLLSSIAAEYSPNSAYTVGTYCIHNNYLYQCTFPISAPGEEWTAAHWRQTSVGVELKTANTDIANLKADIALEYDPTAPYAVDAYCLHDGLFYQCTHEITTGGETWDSTHWQAINVGNELSEINSAIEQIVDNIADNYDATYSYTVGDLCLHEGVLYECTTDTASPAGTWDDNSWAVANLADAVASLNHSTNAISVMIADEYEVKEYDKGAYCRVYDATTQGWKLYKCNDGIASPGEAWNSTHWTQVVIANEIEVINAEIADILTNIAEEYSVKEYSVGDYCLHDGLLYECSVAIASPGEAWNSTHWTQKSITTVLKGKVNQTRKINEHPLSADVTLDAGDIEWSSSETYDSGTVGAELVKITSAQIDALF